jgi:hypothetical protein
VTDTYNLSPRSIKDQNFMEFTKEVTFKRDRVRRIIKNSLQTPINLNKKALPLNIDFKIEKKSNKNLQRVNFI